MTLNLSIPLEPATPPDTRAMMDLLDDLRGCNRRADELCDGITRWTAMGADRDGISRGLVAATSGAGPIATVSVLLDCKDAGWALHMIRLSRTGDEATLKLNIPHRLRRLHGRVLAPMIGVAA
jgi:hypothetical protein